MLVRNPQGGGEIASRFGNFTPNRHGVYDVPGEFASELMASHGFTVATGDALAATVAAKAEADAPDWSQAPFHEKAVFPPRAEMVDYLRLRGVVVPAVGMTNDALTRLCREYMFVPEVEKVAHTDDGKVADGNRLADQKPKGTVASGEKTAPPAADLGASGTATGGKGGT